MVFTVFLLDVLQIKR